MRRHDLVTGIVLLLSIIDFALAAPVLVQECQACIDVVHIPKDVVTVLGRRGEEELGNVVLDYFKMLEEPVESSDAHAPSGSAPPGTDHGPTNNVLQVPGANPASSTVNPDGLMEPLRPSSTASSVKGSLGDASSDDRWSQSYEGEGELHDVPLEEYRFGHGLKLANWHVLYPDPKPSTASEELDWSFLNNQPPPRPVSPKEFGQATKNNPEPADSYLNWDHWMNHEVIPPTNPRLTTKLDSHPNLMVAYQQPTNSRLTTKLDSNPNLMVAYQQPTNSRLTTKLDSNPNLMVAYQQPTNSRLMTEFESNPSLMAAHLPTEPEHVVVSSPPSLDAGSPTDSEHEAVTSPSLGTVSPKDPESQSQLRDPQADIYPSKGKEKVPDTWEVGSTSLNKLPPAGRSLDPRSLAVRNAGDI